MSDDSDPIDELARMRARKMPAPERDGVFVLRLPGCPPTEFPSFKTSMARADAFVESFIRDLHRDRT